MSVTVIDRNSQIKKTTGFAWVTNASDGTMQDTSVTASRAVATDTNGLPVASSTTSTELAGLHGLTASSIVATTAGGILTTLTDPLPVAHGGTGNSTLTAHAVLLGEGTSAVAFASPGTTAYPLVSNGASSDPTFQQLSLTAGVTGTLPIANGGTNSNTALSNGFVIGSNGGQIVENPASNALSMNNGRLTNVANPTSAQDAATKNYVDGLVNGLSWKNAVQAATATVLPAYSYNNGSSGVGATLTATTNGVLTIDGYTVATNDRILVKNETTGTTTVNSVPSGNSFSVLSATGIYVGTILTDTTHAQTTTVTVVSGTTITVASIGTIANGDSLTWDDKPFNGIYTVTQTGSGSTPYILTRSLDQDTPAEFPASAVISEQGTANASTGWVCTTQPTVTIGTTDITFVSFGTVNTYVAGNGLDLTGFTFSISTDNSLTANAGGSSPSLVVKEDPAGAIQTHTAGIYVNVDNSTIDINGSNQVEVKTGGITNTQVSATAAIAITKLSTGTDAQIIISNGSTNSWETVSGDATISDTGVVSISGGLANHLVWNETPGGSITGSNTAFTLAHSPANSGADLLLFLNGLLQKQGGSNDYTISGSNITYNTAPQVGDVLLATYQY